MPKTYEIPQNLKGAAYKDFGICEGCFVETKNVIK